MDEEKRLISDFSHSELQTIGNTVIRGWSNYHNSVVSSDVFQTLDHRMWELLWQWAKRRHSNKPKDWIVNKYWKRSTTRRWNFRTGRNEEDMKDEEEDRIDKGEDRTDELQQQCKSSVKRSSDIF